MWLFTSVSHTCELRDDDLNVRQNEGLECACAKRHRIFLDAADDVNTKRQSRAREGLKQSSVTIIHPQKADMGLPVTIKVNFRGNVKRFLAQDLDKLEWESVEAWVRC